MSNLTTRAGKGSPLTNNELDANFTNLNSDKVEIGGDLSGTSSAPNVAKIQGRAVSADAPAIGEKLVWNGTAWEPSTDPTGEPIGHEDKSSSSISFNSGTRTFTISPVAANFVVWCKGVKYTYTSAQTVVIPDTTGLHFIYFNASGVLSTQMSYFTWEEHAPTAYVYWNSTTQQAVYFGDERHGITLDWQTHEYLHRTRGAAIASGFGASGYTTTGAGATDADAQIDIGGGTFFDEDLQVDIVSTNTPVAGTWQQDLSGPARIPVLYLNGSAWVIDAPTDFPFKVVSGVPQYNLYSGGTWSSAPVANNGYFVSWILATHNLTYPVIAVISQAATNQVSEAEAMTFEGLTLSGFPSVEFRPLYKVIYQHKTSFANNIKASTIAVYDLRSISAAGVAAALVQDHGNLSGLGDDDHAQYLHVSAVRSPSAAVTNSFLPSQASQSGKYLTTDGSNPSWGSIPSGSLTFTGDVTGTGTTGSSTTLTLSNSGAAAGTYTKVTVDAKGRVTTGALIDSSDVTTALGFTPENSANKAVANGYASLDGSGKVPSTQLPSYVDDVIEYANLAAFPATGESGKIYIAIDTAKTYRWSGSAYVEISASPGSTDAVTEGSTNLYFTNARARGAITATGSLSYNNQTGVLSYTQPTNVSAFTNDSGYLTGITGAQVTTALGYTPYNATNPAGYTTNVGTVTSVSGTGTVSGLTLTGSVTSSGSLTLGGTLSLTSGQVTSALGFTPYNATNPSGYITSSALSSYLPLSGGTVTGNLFVTGTIRSTSGVFQLNDGASTGGGLYFYKTITGSGTSLAPSLFAETGLPLYFMNNGSATPKMTLNTSGELSVTSKVYVGGATVNSGYNGIYGTNMVGAASGNKLVYFFNDGSTLKVDAYDYGTSSPLGFTIGGNGGTVNLYTGATVSGNAILHAGNYGSGYFKTINGSSIIGTGDLTVSGTDSTKLPLTGGTLTGNLSIANTGPVLVLRDSDNSGAGAGQIGYISFHDSGSVERAWIGYGSAGSTDLSVYNSRGDVVLSASTGVARVGASTIVTSSNYNDYAPSKTGTGASGTWSINITGNANSLDGYDSNAFSAQNSVLSASDFQYGAISLSTNSGFSLSGLTTDTDQHGRYYYSGAGQIATRYIPVDKNGLYRMKIRWKASAASGTYIAVFLLDTNGNNINGAGTYWAYPWSGASSPTSWTENEYWYFGSQMPSNAAYVAFGISHTNYGGGSATYYVSQLEIQRVQTSVNGSAILHAGNYSGYALPIGGGTLTGNVTTSHTGTLSTFNGRTFLRTTATGDSEIGGGAGSGYTSIFVTNAEAARFTSSALSINGSRPIQISASDGALFITAGSGGWSMGTYFKGSSGTIRAGFGALGSNNDLTYAWIGTGYDGAWMTLTPSSIAVNTDFQLGSNYLRFDQSGVRSWNMRATGGNLDLNSGDGNGSFRYNGNSIFTAAGGVLSGAIRAPQITAGGSTNTDANFGVQGTSHLTGTVYWGGTVGNVNSWSSLQSSSGGNHTLSVNTFVVNRSGYGGISGTYAGEILRVNEYGYAIAGGRFLADSWVQSDRDFPNGTLITTDINYNVTSGDPFVLEIRGNSYGNIVPLDIQYQGYIYSDTIINHGGISNGLNISGLVAINNGGNLCFWFPSQGYWNGYYVRVYVPYATYPRNRVTSITHVGKPTTAKQVDLSANIRQSFHSGNVSFTTAPNSSWGGRIRIGGNGGTDGVAAIATVQATDGNLHLDAGSGKSTYINYYNNGNIYLNGGSYFISSNGSYYNGAAASATNATNATNATYGRYVYDDGAYSGSAAYREASSMHVYYSYLGRLVYNNGAHSGSGWVEASDLGVRYASRSQRANGNFYIDDNYGNGIVGVYNASRYQGVFFMGDAYKMSADGTSLSNMYGIGWSHPNAGGAAGNLTDHGMLIINNGSFRCAISNSIVASGNITAYSDERLKRNWRDMPENFVERLAQVRVGIYERIDDGVNQVGVSAQSLQPLLPEAIQVANDEMKTLSVSYGNAAMASAVELAKEIVNLKREIEMLKSKLH